MEIIESWEDHNANVYVIVRQSKEERQEFNNKEYEAMWMDEMTEARPQLNSFAGTVGYRIAEFDTIERAQHFLLKGIYQYDTNPNIWFEMLKVQKS